MASRQIISLLTLSMTAGILYSNPFILANTLFKKPHTFQGIGLGGVKPNAVINFIKPLLPENPTILEAGAFDGADTVRLSKAWPEGRIYSFEPVPDNYKKLLNATKALTNITHSKLALSDKKGSAEFHVAEMKNQQDVPCASGSLLAPDAHIRYDKNVVFRKKITVDTDTLNNWATSNEVSSIDFMWLDMQGHELAMLSQASMILPTVKLIYIEVEFVKAYKDQPIYQDVKAWLEDAGFGIIARDFDEDYAAKGDAISTKERYFGNVIFANKNYYQIN